jgi:SAM-dependent methyltransferase
MATISSPAETACKICGAETAVLGNKLGRFFPRAFELRRCARCHFAFIANPWTDFAKIYDEDYYRGKGADPLIDYLFELDHPQETNRRDEWKGIVEVIRGLTPISAATRWLDFGCGNGGLVRFCRQEVGCEACGFEEGWIAERARAQQIPILSEADLRSLENSFDVVTAIEVLEHTFEPLEVLRTIQRLLKPGGLFFFTTGNAEPFARDLLQWRYIIPEIHVSFFEPATLALALERAGFRVTYPGFRPGHESIIRFKVLKNLGLRRTTAWHRVLPWKLLARACNSTLRLTAHPVGWKSEVQPAPSPPEERPILVENLPGAPRSTSGQSRAH